MRDSKSREQIPGRPAAIPAERRWRTKSPLFRATRTYQALHLNLRSLFTNPAKGSSTLGGPRPIGKKT